MQLENEQLNQQMQQYLGHCKDERHCSERSIKAYKGDLAGFLVWMQAYGMKQADGEAASQYLEMLTAAHGLRQDTIARKARVLRMFLSYLSEQGMLATEKSHFSPPKEKGLDSRRTAPLSRTETDRLFATLEQCRAAQNSYFAKMICLRDSIMIKLLYYNSMELTEVVGAKLSDYRQREFRLCLKKHTYELFANDLRKDMAEWIANHSYFERSPAYADQLFLSKLGKPISMQMFTKAFNKYRSLAGLDESVTAKTLKLSMEQYAKELVVERYQKNLRGS